MSDTNKAAYIAQYVSDDMDARKSCEQALVFGVVGVTSANPKYVKLPCPNCGFAHNFKREFWCEPAQFSGVDDVLHDGNPDGDA